MDSVVERAGLMDIVDIVKIDVQGAELATLLGATKTLRAATYVLIEHSIIDYNQGGSCWFEVDAVLRKHGFYMSDIKEISPLFGAGQFDGLYVKPSHLDFQSPAITKTHCARGRFIQMPTIGFQETSM